jgi:hypothetical protein
MRRLALLLSGAAILAASPERAFAEWYAFGDFCSTCGTASSANQFFDDGAHDDGAAGDGIYGAIVTIDQPAGRYKWYVDVGPPNTGFGSGMPHCVCDFSGPAHYMKLWTTGLGDVVHLRFGGSPTGLGWGGQALSAGPHGLPPGAQLQIMLTSDPYWLPPGPTVPAHLNGAYWEGVMTLGAPAQYSFVFQTPDQAAVFTDTYNAGCGCSPGEQPTVKVTTTQANSDVLFQFDTVSGRMRGVELGPTPTRATTWGTIKTLYR